MKSAPLLPSFLQTLLFPFLFKAGIVGLLVLKRHLLIPLGISGDVVLPVLWLLWWMAAVFFCFASGKKLCNQLEAHHPESLPSRFWPLLAACLCVLVKVAADLMTDTRHQLTSASHWLLGGDSLTGPWWYLMEFFVIYLAYGAGIAWGGRKMGAISMRSTLPIIICIIALLGLIQWWSPIG